MKTARNSKVLIVLVLGSLGLSWGLSHLSFLFKSKVLTGQLWHYRNAVDNSSYILLGKVSNKSGGIFGATRHLTAKNKKKKRPCLGCLTGKKNYKVYVVNVDSMKNRPRSGSFYWVDVNDIAKAVHFANKKNRYRNVWAMAKNKNKVIIDDELLVALVNKYRDEKFSLSFT